MVGAIFLLPGPANTTYGHCRMYLTWYLIFWACGIWRHMSKSSFVNPRSVGGKSGVMLTDSRCVFKLFAFESHLFRSWRSLNRIMMPLLAWQLSLWHDEKSVEAASVMPRCCCAKLTHAVLVSSSSSSSSPFRPCTVIDHLRRCTSRSRVWRAMPHLECAVQWLVWYGDRNHPYADLSEIWPSQQHLWWPWTRTMISFRPRYFQGGCWDHWAHPLYWTEHPPGLTGGVPPRWGQLHWAGALGACRLSRGLVTRHYPFSVERFIIVLIMIMYITSTCLSLLCQQAHLKLMMSLTNMKTMINLVRQRHHPKAYHGTIIRKFLDQRSIPVKLLCVWICLEQIMYLRSMIMGVNLTHIQ